MGERCLHAGQESLVCQTKESCMSDKKESYMSCPYRVLRGYCSFDSTGFVLCKVCASVFCWVRWCTMVLRAPEVKGAKTEKCDCVGEEERARRGGRRGGREEEEWDGGRRRRRGEEEQGREGGGGGGRGAARDASLCRR
eukprot:2194558-Rhodomonas_salina.1